MNNMLPPLSACSYGELDAALRPVIDGRVVKVVGLLIEGYCSGAAVGDLVSIGDSGQESTPAEVIGLRDGRVAMVALGDTRGLALGTRLRHMGVSASLQCSNGMLGRVIDARGMPLDSGPIPGPFVRRALYASPPSPLSRSLITEALHVGVRAVDGPLALGRGQRIGIMAGAGVGKSTLLGTLLRQCDADVVVLALIGERGREVGEFIHRILTPESRRKTVLVVATSDQSPLERMRGAFVATAVAEHFADQGKDVLLMMDSLTRFAMAQRELGLSMGEPPATRGYTPSVFSLLPKLLERAGRFSNGSSITGIYTVLVEGDDLADPIGDASRSILDGHIVLSRDLASQGHFPAIDVLQSVSRVIDSVASPEHQQAARSFRRMLAQLRDAEELAQIGAYVAGADPELDRALQRKPDILRFLQQSGDGPTPVEQTVKVMTRISAAQ